MYTNELDRDHRFIRAMCDYSMSSTPAAIHDPAVGRRDVADASLWYELLDAIAFSLALGPIAPVTDHELTEHERTVSARSADHAAAVAREGQAMERGAQ